MLGKGLMERRNNNPHKTGVMAGPLDSTAEKADSTAEKAGLKPDIPPGFSVGAEPKTWLLLQITLELCPPNII